MKTLILLVGPPGSGKSTLSKVYTDNGYAYVNTDSQGREGQLKAFNQALSEEKSIIIDRMNFDKRQREKYLLPAKAKSYKTTIIVLHESYETCFNRMILRKNHETVTCIEDARKALSFFFSKYERPEPNEADEIEFRYPPGTKDPALICDIDGTIADISHRIHFVRDGKKDWKGFFAGISQDIPNEWCVNLVNAMSKTHKIVFCSGRNDTLRKETITWLETRCGIDDPTLYMRPRNDFRSDFLVKEIILDFELLTRYDVKMIVDDRQSVCQMWRRRGFVVLQCNYGDY